MFTILREYVDGSNKVIDYTLDGVSAIYTIRKSVIDTPNDYIEIVAPTVLEQILFENQYQTLLLEMGGM